jgi:hypothetical protein
MPSLAVQRRRFLKALGATAMALPFYASLERSAVDAQSFTPPMRLVLLYTGYGGIWDYLRPRGLSGTDAALTADSIRFQDSALAPLAAHVSRMTIIEGLALTSGLQLQNGATGARTHYLGHDNGSSSIWTGSPIQNRAMPAATVPSGPSLDVVLGQRFGGDTALRSLELGIACIAAPGSDPSTTSYSNAGGRLPGYSDPRDAFRALFGATSSAGTPPDAGAAQRESARRRAVIAEVQATATRLRARLAGPERAKLDEHLAALADIGARLTSGGQGHPTVACGTPTPPGAVADIRGATTAHFNVITQAFACDRVRFVTAGWGLGAPAVPGLYENDAIDMHGDVAHGMGDGGPTSANDVQRVARQRIGKLQNWYATQIAGLMDDLAAQPAGNGTAVLENTLIVWAQDFGKDIHGGLNVPFVLLGGAQNRLRMGRYLNVAAPGADRDGYAGAIDGFQPHNKLLVAIANAFGLADNTFGTTEFQGALSGVTA